MANRWGIPRDIENKVRVRDTRCVYCGVVFGNDFSDRATFEHVDNDVKNFSEENIVLCCFSCNASKGEKKLREWLNSPYCTKKGITMDKLAPVICKTLVR